MKRKNRYLVFTNAYPYPDLPYYGIHVLDQVKHWRSLGEDVEVFFINGRLSRWNYVTGLFRWFWRMLRRGRNYDLIIAHHSYCCLIAAIFNPFRRPILYRVAEGTLHFSPWNRFFVRLALWLVDEAVFVSPRLPIDLGLPGTDQKILPSGIDLVAFRNRPVADARGELGWSLEDEIVLYAAKERKSYERFDLIRGAVERLSRGGRRIRLVRLEGVERSRVPAYLNGADVLVVASRGEGSPKIVKEALACNTPVVSLRVGTVPELLAGVDSGYLCDDSESSMEGQLEKALRHRGRGRGREKVLGLGVEKMAEAFLEVCRLQAARKDKGIRRGVRWSY